MFTKRLNEYGGLRTVTPVPNPLVLNRSTVPTPDLTEIKSLR